MAAHTYGESPERESLRGSTRTPICRPDVLSLLHRDERAPGLGRRANYQALERNRQRPIARGEFAEQITVQIVHVRANEDSDPRSVAEDPAISNDGEDLPRVRIAS
jgi:hypothetical protein